MPLETRRQARRRREVRRPNDEIGSSEEAQRSPQVGSTSEEEDMQRTPPVSLADTPNTAHAMAEQNSNPMEELRREFDQMRRLMEDLRRQNEELRRSQELIANSHPQTSTAQTLHGVRLPRGGWLTNPFEELKYSGRKDELNPVRFVKRFERIATREDIQTQDRLHYFCTCLKDGAAAWMDNREFEDYEDARRAFLEYFWDSTTQQQIRYKIYTGKYNPAKDGSMTEYVLKHARQARVLTSPMEESEIVASMARHFDETISREVRPAWVKTVEQMTEILHHLETERKIRRDVRRRVEPEVTEKKRDGMRKVDDKRQLAITTGREEDGEEKRRNSRYYDRAYRKNEDRHYDRRFKYERYRKPNRNELSDSEEEKKPEAESRKESKNKNRDQKMEERKPEEKKTNNHKQRTRIAAIKKKVDSDFSEYSDDQLSVTLIRTDEIIRNVDEACEEQQQIPRKPDPFIEVEVNGCEIRALVDTGAQISVIAKELYQELQAKGARMITVPIAKFPVKGAFSDKGEVLAYKIAIDMKIKEQLYNGEFYVVKRLPYRMIIGIEFLVAHKAIINCATNRVEIQLNEIPRVVTISVDDAQRKLEQLNEQYEELFAAGVGCVNHYTHKIEVTTKAPYKAKTYPIPEIHRAKVMRHIAELEEAGIVEKAPTQYVNPLVAVVKKTGEIRLCLDARELNKRMVNDHAQPPTIDEVFRRIGHRRFFSTLDVSKAFWQIPLEKESKQYTGFMAANQTYVFCRMPFGLKTAGASFSRAMNLAMDEERTDFMIVYLDDILIASNSLEEHMEHLELTFKKLKEKGFKLNKEKCQFMKKEITFLGHTFNEISAEIVSETKSSVINFPRPKNKKSLQSFLGLINWERRFIKNLAQLTKPLEELLKKDRKFVWTDKQQEAFVKIKQAFQGAENLCLIKPGLPFGIFIDASSYGLGARLY